MYFESGSEKTSSIKLYRSPRVMIKISKVNQNRILIVLWYQPCYHFMQSIILSGLKLHFYCHFGRPSIAHRPVTWPEFGWIPLSYALIRSLLCKCWQIFNACQKSVDSIKRRTLILQLRYLSLRRQRGVSSVPFPFWFPFQLHCKLVSLGISSQSVQNILIWGVT